MWCVCVCIAVSYLVMNAGLNINKPHHLYLHHTLNTWWVFINTASILPWYHRSTIMKQHYNSMVDSSLRLLTPARTSEYGRGRGR